MVHGHDHEYRQAENGEASPFLSRCGHRWGKQKPRGRARGPGSYGGRVRQLRPQTQHLELAGLGAATAVVGWAFSCRVSAPGVPDISYRHQCYVVVPKADHGPTVGNTMHHLSSLVGSSVVQSHPTQCHAHRHHGRGPGPGPASRGNTTGITACAPHWLWSAQRVIDDGVGSATAHNANSTAPRAPAPNTCRPAV